MSLHPESRYLPLNPSRALPELDEEMEGELIAAEYQVLQEVIQLVPPTLPTLRIGDERSKPLGLGGLDTTQLDFEALVKMRRQHQTRQAALGVRTRQGTGNVEGEKVISIRRRIIGRMHEILKEQKDQAVGTGVERSARWRAAAPGGRAGVVDGEAAPGLAAGNSVNAAAMAATIAKQVNHQLLTDGRTSLISVVQVATRRRNIFTKAGVPMLRDAVEACITILRPLQIGDYGVIFTEQGLMIGHGEFSWFKISVEGSPKL